MNEYKDYTLADICISLDALELQVRKLVELKRIQLFNYKSMSEHDKEMIRNV